MSRSLGIAILVVSSALGCRTSNQSPSATDRTQPAISSPTIQPQEPEPVPTAAQICRGTLRHIQGAKEQWALENRKLQSAVPTEADLLGTSVGYLRATPKCPSGGIYTLGSGKDVPLCSIAGHKY